MKKLIKNLIHLWDLKLYEKQINRTVELIISDNDRLKKIIYHLSNRNTDQEAYINAKEQADFIASLVEKDVKMEKMVQEMRDKLNI